MGIILLHLTNFVPFIAPEFKSQRLTHTHTPHIHSQTHTFKHSCLCQLKPVEFQAILMHTSFPPVSLSYAPCMDLNSLPLSTLTTYISPIFEYICRFYYIIAVYFGKVSCFFYRFKFFYMIELLQFPLTSREGRSDKWH